MHLFLEIMLYIVIKLKKARLSLDFWEIITIQRYLIVNIKYLLITVINIDDSKLTLVLYE